MKNRRGLLLMAVIVASAGFLAACDNQGSQNKAAKKSITLMQTSELTSLDNTNQAMLPEFNTLTNISEGLYRLNDKDQPVPAMATKIVKPTDNGKKYIFHIRKTAKWSNGDPVKAEDFEYSWKRSLNPANNPVYTYVFSGIKNADSIINNKKSYKTLGIKALGDKTLEITLDHPMAYFNKLVAMPVFMPQNKSFVQKVGIKKYGTNAKRTVSNGAFKIADWTGTNDTYKLVRNPYYWDKSAIKLDEIKYQTVKDSNTAHNLFENGKLDDATISGVTAKSLQKNRNLKHVSKAWTYYLQVNQRQNQPLANRKLRQAISLVINRPELTSKVLADGSLPASSFVSPGTAIDPTTGKDFSKETSFSVQPNVKKARSLWNEGKKEAGLKGSVSLSIVGDDQDVTKNVAQYLQSQLNSKLPGVKVTIANIPDKAQQARRSEGKFDLAQWYWLADFGDPINYLGILTTNNTMNPGKFSDSTYDSLVQKAKNAGSQASYWRYLRQAEKRLMSQNGIIPLYYVRESHLVNPKLHGVEYHVAGFADYTRSNISK
ncbi:peptide ABC transporter substrate-binding protein [Lentilactobacillus parabuchneri]|uniref:peptide ABC transporter substrate-binding protein n=1 Tax=Lentilactobacillus parabuchneri TaxID=152331 RepID=UPI000A1033E5|nr:peptide ABC transporter substrate-binding protein [Lentilactobacillus parabuchneri]ORN05199.1 Dipeptide-binding protein DppE precursor [Lentilactobacillus parabuchneri]